MYEICAYCGMPYKPKHTGQRFCCTECKQAAQQLHHKTRNRKRGHGADHKHRQDWEE